MHLFHKWGPWSLALETCLMKIKQYRQCEGCNKIIWRTADEAAAPTNKINAALEQGEKSDG